MSTTTAFYTTYDNTIDNTFINTTTKIIIYDEPELQKRRKAGGVVIGVLFVLALVIIIIFYLIKWIKNNEYFTSYLKIFEHNGSAVEVTVDENDNSTDEDEVLGGDDLDSNSHHTSSRLILSD